MVRIAAAGDLHIDRDNAPDWRKWLAPVAADADLLLLAGDLTQNGVAAEADGVVEALADVSLPICAVLGNHDLNANADDEVRKILERRGVVVLEGRHTVVSIGARSVGIAGSVGFGGGFPDACCADFGELEMKAFAGRTRRLADALGRALGELRADVRVVLLHYAPVRATLAGEPRELYPFLGSGLLARAIDAAGADLVLHGHAHHGSERGITPGGVEVRNVAQPVIGAAYRVFRIPDAAPGAGG